MKISRLAIITLAVFCAAPAYAKESRSDVCQSIQDLFKPSNSISISNTDIVVCFDTPSSKCHVPWTKEGSTYSYSPDDDNFKNVMTLAQKFGCSFGGMSLDGGSPETQLSDSQKICVGKALALWDARYYEPTKLPLEELRKKASDPDFASFCSSRLGTYHSPDKVSVPKIFADVLQALLTGTGPIADAITEKTSNLVSKPVEAVGSVLHPSSGTSAAPAN